MRDIMVSFITLAAALPARSRVPVRLTYRRSDRSRHRYQQNRRRPAAFSRMTSLHRLRGGGPGAALCFTTDWMRPRGEGSRPSGSYIEPLQDSVRDPLAALACEGINFAEKRVDVVGERGLEQPSRAVEPCLHGCLWEPKQVSRLFDAHVFDDPRDENGTKLLGQIIDRAFQQLAELALGQSALRIRG